MGFSAIGPTPNVATALARDREAPELVAAGRSITEPAIQRLYRDYVVAIVDVVRPTHIGLAAETNLIRAAAPRAVYDAVVRMTNDDDDLRDFPIIGALGLSSYP
jgi:hypothetical protein